MHQEIVHLKDSLDQCEGKINDLFLEINERDSMLQERHELQAQVEDIYSLKPGLIKIAQLFEKKQIFLNQYSF